MPSNWTYVEPNACYKDGYYLHASGDVIEINPDGNAILWDHFTEDSQNLLDTNVYEAMENYNQGAYP